jgi:(4S)-4-hydroxy-5-phosphonooxypentane-2,3-dione isomerase
MFILVAYIQAKQGHEDFVLEQLRQLEPASQQESGCLFYVVNRSKENPAEFLVYEQYRDEAAFQSHCNSPHFLKYFPKIKEVSEEPRLVFYDPISETSPYTRKA